MVEAGIGLGGIGMKVSSERGRNTDNFGYGKSGVESQVRQDD